MQGRPGTLTWAENTLSEFSLSTCSESSRASFFPLNITMLKTHRKMNFTHHIFNVLHGTHTTLLRCMSELHAWCSAWTQLTLSAHLPALVGRRAVTLPALRSRLPAGRDSVSDTLPDHRCCSFRQAPGEGLPCLMGLSCPHLPENLCSVLVTAACGRAGSRLPQASLCQGH